MCRAVLALIALFLPVTQACGKQKGRPSIVLILVDDLGWADLGCYGNQWIETPAIDRLAGQGARFTDFYAACPVCSPTRASIQSGQYQARFGLTAHIPGHWRPFEKLVEPTNAAAMPLEIVTMAEALKNGGYATGYFGKWHLGGPQHYPDKQGYDTSIVTGGRHWAPQFRTTPKVKVPDGTYLADFLTDQTLSFIQKHQNKPFFVMLSHYAVHIPLQADPKLIAKYNKKPRKPGNITHSVYAAMVEHVDQSVARVMQKLEDLKLAENTLLILTSDNGGLRKRYDNLGEVVTSNAPLRDEKGSLYEGGIRVPLVMRWPGVIPEKMVCKEPSISIDFHPTLTAAAGIKPPKDYVVDGKNLLPVLKNATATLDRDALCFHFPHYHHSRPAGAIRSGDYKLIHFFDDDTVELYNLKQDTGEKTNLALRMPKRAMRLKKQMADWREQIQAKMPKKNPRYDVERAKEWWSRRSGRKIDLQAMRKRLANPQYGPPSGR